MSDNPQYGEALPFPLPGIRVVRLTGRDAMAFAQAQFMNDVAALSDGTWQWNGWLDPKGRVQALFALLRIDGETLWCITSSDADAFAAALTRFLFRSKLSVAVLPLQATGRLSRPDTARGAVAHVAPDGAVELDLSGDGGVRSLRLAPGAPDAGAVDVEWWRLHVVHGWPGLPGVDLSAWTPQQLSLQRLSAFSVKKGCYPGQEIVARTHFLGRAKRGLLRFTDPGAHAGSPVLDAGGREVGQVVCVAGGEGLAVVPSDADAAMLTCEGAALAALPLQDGLSR